MIEAVLLITTMKSFNNSNIDLEKTQILVDFINRNFFYRNIIDGV
ncbi:conserved hypothetical protein [Leptospira interrogans serovar Manilae]|uniref:Uncharacterized protein n=1 Tax=Leptospira interrogans serovar Manilae TaxID=214675 RepID=A0AAQ1P1N3_LEPIR|nr:conserved hypothetical protein [Leptospira interrogans serovar Manilae]